MVNYAIVGGGRLARHFSHYFHLLEIPHTCWARDRYSRLNTYKLPNAEQRLKKTLAHADRVLLLVTDKAIAALLQQYPLLYEKQLIHCSGALSFPGVAGAHPLMTYAENLYELEVYQSVPFMLETGCSFDSLFPGLANPHFIIRAEDKARYHAMCVMAGNFAQVLWQGIANRFEQQLELPAHSLNPYLQQIAANFAHAPATALTGPLTRNDQHTLERNLQALDDDPLQDLYQAFVRFYQSGGPSSGPMGERQGAMPAPAQLEQAL